MTAIPFALNHMTAPALPLDDFLALAASLGMSGVEIRNDLDGNAILDGTSAETIRELAGKHDLTIISINALQRFNQWSHERAREARALIGYARDCGAEALVLVPVNDGSGREDGVRQDNLRTALIALKPMIEDAGIIGLVEPLGFDICSLRSKTEAVAAIQAVGGDDIFKLVHDTFHHHLSGDDKFYPQATGLVHISGVADPDMTVGDMRDSHRILVDAEDRIDNVRQIRRLCAGGYSGPFSFEPFSPAVHQVADIAAALRKSMMFLSLEP